MSIHDEIQELIPAYALGALDADEAAQTEGHLASCDRCARVFAEYRSVADSIALAVPLVELPADLKLRTLQHAVEGNGNAAGATRASFRTPATRPQPWWQRISLAPVLASAALLIALLAFGWNAWQTMQLNQQLTTQRDLMTVLAYAQGNALVIRGTDLAPQAVGRLYADRDAMVAALVTVDLPPLRSDQAYQVWLTEPDGHTASGGLFTVDNQGNGWLLVRAPQKMDAYVQVGVTVEPRGGSAAPTTGQVLAAKLASP